MKQQLQKMLFFFLLFVITSSTAQNFRTVWRTTGASETITIPTIGAGTYNYTVDWGDGTSDTGQTGDATHTYATAGDHTVTISGTFSLIYFNNGGDRLKMRSIEEWGSSIAWDNMTRAFNGCSNLVNNATDIPNLSGVTSMREMFSGATNIGTGSATNWNSWNTSTITDMHRVFTFTTFNKDISNWNVAEVIDMSNMFDNSPFNQDISSWNVGKATSMFAMFRDATSFNQNLGSWNVASVTDMSQMFENVTLSTANYDALLTGWNALNLQNGITFSGGNSKYDSQAAITARANMIASDSWMITDGGLTALTTNFKTVWRTTTNNEQITIPTTGAGYNYTVDWGDGSSDVAQTGNASHTYATAGDYTVTILGTFPRIYFNNAGDKNKIRSIREWGSSIAWTSMSDAFRGCTNLVNNARDTPDLSGVTDARRMFSDCVNIGSGSAINWNSWNVSTVTNMLYMFKSTISFNQNIGSWNVANVTIMSSMFWGASIFNQDISSWNVAKVTDMKNMFIAAAAFNQNIGSWDVSKVTNMSGMFGYATVFNQNIGSWNVGEVLDMSSMFYEATSFNQNLGNWNVAAVTTMTNMFFGVTLSTTNYDALLTGWNALSLQNGVTFSGGNSTYASQAAIDARANMISSDSWTITDGGVIDNNWTGAINTDWNTATNWDYGVPGSSQNLVIPNLGNDPVISTTTGAVANNITITDGVLSITNGGSLRAGGTVTGNLTYNVHTPDANWHLVSPPVTGETIDDAWVAANSLSTGTGANRGAAGYDNSTDANGSWGYFTAGASFGLAPGEGFSLQRTGAGDYGLTGTYTTAPVSFTAQQSSGASGNDWNLLGNPFTAYIDIAAFITANTANFSGAYQALYVWDNAANGGAGAYVPKTTGYFQPGQGFFVNADAGTAITFTSDIQSHQTGITFYRTTNTDFVINLTLTDGSKTKTTEVNYVVNKTTGLDPRFDIGTFSGTNTSFALYTQLISDNNGINFMRQALPNSNYENMIIPVGVNATAGTEITFTADIANLPTGLDVYLENRTANTFTKLSNNGNYTITLNADSNGIGQFYLRTSSSSLSVNNVLLENVSLYKTSATSLRIVGLQQGKASIKIVNVLGKQVVNKSFTTNGVSDVSLPKLATGIYIVQLQTENGKLNKKIIVE